MSPDLVTVANDRDFAATHVKFLGRLGSSDRSLAVLAIDTDAVFVTNNARDFKRIYRELDLHPGLVVILPSRSLIRQTHLFVIAIDTLAAMPDGVNLLIEVAEDGAVTVSDWSRNRRNDV